MITTPNIPHADLIRAVLDGKVVQTFSDTEWISYDDPRGAIVDMALYPERYFRLKPESVVRWHVIYKHEETGIVFVTEQHIDRPNAHPETCKLLRLEFDPETLELISAKTEAP